MFIRKFFVTIAVAGIFLIYSLGIRHQSPIIKKPASVALNTSSPTPASSTGNATNSSTSTSTGSSTANSSSGQYSDGTYTGSVADAYYGNVQVSATISGGKITAVKFLQYPNTHSTSVAINQQAMPYLQQEAISSQSSKVQIVSGATFTSQAFIESLSAALSKA